MEANNSNSLEKKKLNTFKYRNHVNRTDLTDINISAQGKAFCTYIPKTLGYKLRIQFWNLRRQKKYISNHKTKASI